MKLHLQSAALAVAAVIALAAPVSAQKPAQKPAEARLRANERYCLEEHDPAPAPLMCRFETMEQCIASKVAPGDSCLLNPIIAFRQRR